MMIAILESDAFAIAMLLVIFSGFGVLGLLLLSMRRHVARRDPHVDQLLEELAMEKRDKTVVLPAPKAWEKEADWWKGTSRKREP